MSEEYLNYNYKMPVNKGKQETLEEAAERLYPENWESIMDGQHDSNSYERNAFIKGANWQAEIMYSQEDMIEFGKFCHNDANSVNKVKTFKELFEQFKKK